MFMINLKDVKQFVIHSKSIKITYSISFYQELINFINSAKDFIKTHI